MKKTAKMAAALGALLVFVMLLPTAAVQAYSYSETSGKLTVSYETQIVVPKGEDRKLSVSATTSDKHKISYRWNRIYETDKVDESGNTLWSVTRLDNSGNSSYTVKKMTEDMSFYCEVWCDDNNYTAVFEDIYAGDILQLNEPETFEKTGNRYCVKYFVFTPSESGTYMFRSTGSVEARLSVFNDLTIDSNGLISSYTSNADSTGQYGKNGGTATAELVAGKSYAIQAYISASEKGAYSVTALKYTDTDFTLTTSQTIYNVDKKSDSTTMKVKAVASGSKKSTDDISYQWYVYDPIEWDYVPIDGATGTSWTVKNSSLSWSENSYRCDAVDSYGQSDSIYFSLYHDTGWSAASNGYDERVAYNSYVSLSVLTGQTQDIYNSDGAWISEEFVEDDVKRSYQWYVLSYDDSYYDGDKFTAIKGADSSVYKTGPVTENARYMCVVTDASGYCDYRQFYVRPVLMDVSVDQTYYAVKSGDTLSVKVSADAIYKNTKFDYTWYKGVAGLSADAADADSGFLDYVEVERWSGKSSVKLTDITQTQYLKCEVKATSKKDGESVTDYVEIDFVVDPGTGYDQMYTTSSDKNVKGASLQASSQTTENTDGSTTTVTTRPDGSSFATTIAKATSADSAVIMVEKDAGGKVTSATAEVTSVSESIKSTIPESLITQIMEAAGEKTKNVIVTMNVVDHKDRAQYTVVYDAAQVSSGEVMYLYTYNEKKNTCTLVDKKTYSLGKKGKITLSSSENAMYLLAASADDALALIGQATIVDENTPLASGETADNKTTERLIFVISIGVIIILIRILYAIRAKKRSCSKQEQLRSQIHKKQYH